MWSWGWLTKKRKRRIVFLCDSLLIIYFLLYLFEGVMAFDSLVLLWLFCIWRVNIFAKRKRANNWVVWRSKIDALIEGALQQILSRLIASKTLLHASKTTQSAIESALSHRNHTGIITRSEFSRAFLLEANLLGEAEGNEKDCKEDFCYWYHITTIDYLGEIQQ